MKRRKRRPTKAAMAKLEARLAGATVASVTHSTWETKVKRHPADIETIMLYGKAQTMGVVYDVPRHVEPTKVIRLRAHVEVEVSTLDDDAIANAVADLRRTLEREGYTPSIDVRGRQ